MSLFSPRKKKHSGAPSTSAPASGLASSRVTSTHRLPQFHSNSQSQSHLQPPQEKQQSQPVCPWSAHAPPSGQSSSPFLRQAYALSTSATAAGELFLFGGLEHSSRSPSNDLYVFSSRDFSTPLLPTSGDVPNPRYGHRAVLISTTLLIWGGVRTDSSDQNAQNQSSDDSFYLLNLVSREWTRIVVNGPGPGGRCNHTMTLVGSKLFVFGGRTVRRRLNDIWALDLDCLKSDPFWESCEAAPGNEKPLPRFGGYDGQHDFNDTWSFNILTRKWTELQCTGSIPSPVQVMLLSSSVILCDLTALNLSTQRWTAFQDIGPSPCGRSGHAMACDGTRVFVLGGQLSPGEQVDEAKLIHVLDTTFKFETDLLIYPKPDPNTVKHSEKTTQLAQTLSADHPTQGQAQHGIFSSSDAGVAHSAFPSQTATSEDMGRPASPQITRSTEHHGKLVPVAPDAPSGKETARLEDGRLIELERQLSETLVAKTKLARRTAQLTDELALKSSLLEQAAEEKKRAGLELRELQAKLDESLLSRDHALEQAQSALQKATSCASNADEWSQLPCEHETEVAEVRAELEGKNSELEAVRLQLTDAEDGWAKSKAEADTLRAQTAAGLVNTDVERVMHRLMERMRTMEAEMSSLRGNEKSIESMECRNEG
ncbi:hypothetical protein F5888DRAFT_1637137 [Russula emetica]|nr:hypothetical protein F5888DRAFT_1637137 [Russula emetica]